jgi:hypothetical protein
MPRALKTFAQLEPRNIATAAPKTNLFTLDLAGLSLTSDQLQSVRQTAVKAAMEAAAGLGGRVSMDDFGTFSTFSTFSTFGSGAARPDINVATPAIRDVIDRVLRPG